MAINAAQLRQQIVRPALKLMKLYSPQAEQLLMGTMAQESALGTYVYQVPSGPARGIFQMEPDTERDIWENYLAYRPELAEAVRKIKGTSPEPLIWNLYYQVAMARLHYRRVAEPLPVLNDIPAMAQYWKRYYNTPKGKGTEAEFIENYHRYLTEDHENG